MKQVLIITYYWPPGSGPGVQRWLKMSGLLPEHGYMPTIITVRDGSYPNMDPSLLAEVHPDIEVIRTETREPFTLFNRLRGKKGKEVSVGLIGIKDSKSPIQQFAIWVRANFFIPDARKGWKPFALKAAREVIARKGIDTVITSGPPHSTHVVGKELKKKHGLRWIADFRDPWANIYYHDLMPISEHSLNKHRRQESDILSTADAVTVVSPGMKREFEDRAKKIAVIFNGYDEADFDRSGTASEQGQFTLSYIGNLKPNQNVPVLWKVLSELLKENEAFARAFRLQLIGRKDEHIIAQLKKLIPAKNLQLVDYVAHHEAAQAMQDTSLLLFVIPKAENNELILTGKLFEYLASGTTMLSLGPVNGDAASILKESGRDAMIEYHDEHAIRKNILASFESFAHPDSGQHEVNDAVKAFSRKGQTDKLIQLIEKA